MTSKAIGSRCTTPLGIGGPISDEEQFEQVLSLVERLFDEAANDPAHPLGGLVELLADRIREYEARVHPWPDTSTPITVLASLMEEHGLKQAGLPEIGAEYGVSGVWGQVLLLASFAGRLAPCPGRFGSSSPARSTTSRRGAIGASRSLPSAQASRRRVGGLVHTNWLDA